MSRVLAGALVAAVALAGTIYWEVQDPARPDLVATPGRSPPLGTVRTTPGIATIDAVQGWATTALGRPLFREDRRAPKAANGDAAQKADAPMRLTGVITGQFGNRAIFMSGNNANPVVAREGAHIGDFVVRSIGPDQVVVESAGKVRTLKPSFAEGTNPPRR